MPLFRLSSAVALVLLATAARAGVVIEGKDEGETQRFVMEGQKLRIDTGEDGVMIFDAAAQKTIHLDPANKTYTEFTQAELARMRGAANERAPKRPRTTKYEKTGRTDEAVGKKCDVYRVVESDAEPDDEEQTLCLASFGTFGVSRDDFAPFRAFGEFASQLSGGEVERSWADLPGIPLIAWEKEGAETRETFRATKVEKRRVAASEFAAPAGWKKGPGLAEQMKEYEKQMKDLEQQMKQGQGGK